MKNFNIFVTELSIFNGMCKEIAEGNIQLDDVKEHDKCITQKQVHNTTECKIEILYDTCSYFVRAALKY